MHPAVPIAIALNERLFWLVGGVGSGSVLQGSRSPRFGVAQQTSWPEARFSCRCAHSKSNASLSRRPHHRNCHSSGPCSCGHGSVRKLWWKPCLPEPSLAPTRIAFPSELKRLGGSPLPESETSSAQPVGSWGKLAGVGP
jgi:hypothetical protein